MQTDNDKNAEVKELKRELKELREAVRRQAWARPAVVVLALVMAFQCVVSLLWTWNLRVVEREWIPNLDYRLQGLERVDPQDADAVSWLNLRRRALQAVLDAQVDFAETSKPEGR